MARLNKLDLKFILDQIKISEQHAAGTPLTQLIDDPLLSFGVRTVDGTYNNLIPGQEEFGASDNLFPRLLPAEFVGANASDLVENDGDSFTVDTNGPEDGGLETLIDSNYSIRGTTPVTPGSFFVSGDVVDADPRTISNLITDQSSVNQAAVDTYNSLNGFQPGDAGYQTVQPRRIADPNSTTGGTLPNPAFVENLFIQNVAPDEGLSAPFNSWMTLFGQFFDHGLDLVSKGDNGTIYIPLQPDDPLYNPATPQTNFMVVTRVTTDAAGEATNTTTSWIDQNQTYTSHASHQAWIREYVIEDGKVVSTGNLLDGANGGLATWADVKAQARNILGFDLNDFDIDKVPMLAVDQYGRLLLDSNGKAQLVTGLGGDLTQDHLLAGSDDTYISGQPASLGGTPVSTASAVRFGHAFLDDINNSANPHYDDDRNPNTPSINATADSDTIAGVNDGNRATYDNELLDAHYITGDGRGNENIGLTAVHHIFHSEHNRQAEEIKGIILADAQELLAGGASQTEALTFLNEWLKTDVSAVPTSLAGLNWEGERIFQAARFATEMQYQHLVFEEFGRKVMPAINVFAGIQTDIDASIVAEFAHVVYRFGHSMLTETVDRIDANGTPVLEGGVQIDLIKAFLNPLEYAEREALGGAGSAAGEIVNGMTRQVGNEIDEFVTGALQNNLLGLPLDLGAINIARGRDAGIPSLNSARRQFFAMTGDSQLQAYSSWADFGENIKHPESLVNFIAAYGRHSSITGATTLADKRAAAMLLVNGNMDINGDGIADVAPADRVAFMNSTGAWANGANGVTTTGLDDVDFWIGGLAEETMPFGGLLGSTFGFVFETQMERLQDGDRFYYLARTAGLNFLSELEGNSFAEMVMLNTPNVGHLPGDIFSTPNYILEVNQSIQSDYNANDTNLHSDPAGQVVRNNPGTPGPDTNYLKFIGGEHVVLGGTNNNDILIADIGDDTVWGDGGNDRIEGGAGNDMLNGGDGDDIIFDTFGDDNIKGGAGDDVINAGAGIDLIISGDGNDFVFAGPDEKETIAGQGNDFVYGGDGANTVFGDEGADWIEGGAQADLLQGDGGDPFQLSPAVGNDVIIGGTGNDDYDSESGDDILVNGDNIQSTNDDGTERFEGMLGYDWVTFARDTSNDSTRADLEFTGLLPPTVEPFRDRFDLVEGLSGWDNNDTLRGDSLTSTDLSAINAESGQNNALNSLAQIKLIDGLQALLDGMLGDADDVTAGFQSQTSFSGGNIILGGGGSDTIEGRGGDDLIDGDKWLNAQISYVDSNNVEQRIDSMTQIVDLMTSGALKPSQLKVVREINTAANGSDIDTAVYSRTNGVDFDTEYELVQNANGTWTVTHFLVDGTGARVPDANGDATIGANGIDTLHNIERLRFEDAGADGVLGDDPDTVLNEATDDIITNIDLVPLVNTPAAGTININGTVVTGNASEGVNLTATLAATDDDLGINNASIRYDWQVETVSGNGNWVTIRYNSPTFNPDDGQVGKTLRVVATFEDGAGNQEQLFQTVVEAPNGVININDLPTAKNTEVTATEDSPFVFGTGNFGFSDPDTGDTLGSIVIESLPDAGTFTLNGVVVQVGDIVTAEQLINGDLLNNQNIQNTNVLRYLPTTDVNGPDLVNFSFFVRDQNDVQSLAPKTVFINVEAGNDAPTGTDKAVTLAEDAFYTFAKGDFGFTDIDAGDDLRAVRIDTLPTGGSLTLNGVAVALNQVVLVTAITANQLKYTPVANGNGYPAVNSEYTNFTFSVQDLDQAFAATPNTMTINVTQVNDVATGVPVISDTTPTEATPITVDTATIADIDGLTAFTYQWQSSVDGVNWANVGTNSSSFNPTQNEVNKVLRTVISFTDGDGNVESLITAPTSIVGDLYTGTTGVNVRTLTNGQDVANGLAGADVLNGLGEDDLLDGGNGADVLNGGDGNDNLIGGTTDAGADTLIGGAGIDRMEGGAGNDSYEVDNVGDLVIEVAGQGTDSIDTSLNTYSLNTAALNTVENLSFSGEGDFVGTGNTAANQIEGSDGNDRLDGLGGTDRMFGGAGNDIYVATAQGEVFERTTANEGIDLVESNVTYSLASTTTTTFEGEVFGLANVENLNLTGTGAISGTGNALANVLTGNTANNTLDGGSNTVGVDTLIGGGGGDIYRVRNTGDIVTESLLDAAIDTVQTSLLTYTLAANVENLGIIAGTTGARIFTGNDLNNTIVGNGGSDTLDGGNGNDIIRGGANNDIMVGGQGNDVFDSTSATGVVGAPDAVGNDTMTGGIGDDNYAVDSSLDVVVENAGEGTDIIRTSLASFDLSTNGANVENLTFMPSTRTDSVIGVGNALNNVITGAAGNDTLTGNAGNDTINGGNGNDIFKATLHVGSNDGNDSYVGGTGASSIDTLDMSATTAGVSVTTTGASGSEIGSDTLSSIENFIGGSGNDTINVTGSGATANVIDGGAGVDIINANGANDIIIGGAGNDFLNGGTGFDTFVFGLGFGNDQIIGSVTERFDAVGNGSLLDQDMLDIRGLLLADFSSVSITGDASNTLVTIGADTIQLVGVNVADVSQQDFIIV